MQLPACYSRRLTSLTWFSYRLLSFCANVAACLPFKKCDEPYSLLHLINTTISRRGDYVLSAQKKSLESACDVPPATAGAAGAAALDGNVETHAHTSSAQAERDGSSAGGEGATASAEVSSASSHDCYSCMQLSRYGRQSCPGVGMHV